MPRLPGSRDFDDHYRRRDWLAEVPAQGTVIVRRAIRLLRTGGLLIGFVRSGVMMRAAAAVMMAGVRLDRGYRLVRMRVTRHADNRIDRHQGD